MLRVLVLIFPKGRAVARPFSFFAERDCSRGVVRGSSRERADAENLAVVVAAAAACAHG